MSNYLSEIIKGIGTNEKVLIELLCSKGAFEIQHLSQAYKKSNMIDRKEFYLIKF